MEHSVGQLEDVVLRERRDLLAPIELRVLKGITADALTCWDRVKLQCVNDIVALLILDARVEVLFVFAHDYDVHSGMLGSDERVVGNGWPDIGVEAKRLANGHIEALETATLRRRYWRLQEDASVAQ